MLEVITCMLAGGLIGAMVGAAMMDIRWRRWRNRTLEDGKP